MHVRRNEPDLSQPRDVGAILGGAFSLYRRRPALFAAIAFSVVVPVDVLVYGVAGEMLWSDSDLTDSMPLGAELAAWVVPWVVTTPLITAGHVRAVIELSEGASPTAGSALSAAARRLPAVATAVVLSAVISAVGLVFLVAPGIYLWVRWWMSAQAVAAEDLGPIKGMKRSWELVHDNWWRVLGISLLISLIAGVLASLAGVPFIAAGAIVDSGPLTLLGQILLDGITLSFAALAGTLLFFDLRARHDLAPTPAWDAPERPY